MREPESRSILFIVRGDDTVPSCRFRAWQFLEPLRALGIKADCLVLEKSKNPWKQLIFHVRMIRRLRDYRAVIFQKLLEPLRLRFIRLFNPNLFYDFDDAMYLASDGGKFAATMKASPSVIAGNAVLAAEAGKYNSRVVILPTVVPVPDVNPATNGNPPEFVLSWIGTSANLPFLDPLLAMLETMNAGRKGLSLRILTEKPERAPLRPWITAQRWSRGLEEREFQNCDLGLMPLRDDGWCRGKCACKALQYLSYGKPVIASPVGVNREIFAGGAFGRLADTPEEWKKAIELYRADADLLRRSGLAGREFVLRNYELKAWTTRLAEMVFEPEHPEVSP